MLQPCLWAVHPSGVQVTTDDEKSQAIKAAYDGYLVNDFTASNELYSDETAIYINSVESISNEENLAAFSSHHDFYSDISMYLMDSCMLMVHTFKHVSVYGWEKISGSIQSHGPTHGLYGKVPVMPQVILLKFLVMLHTSGVRMERLPKPGSLVINPII